MKLNFTLKLLPFIYHETSAKENEVLIHQILSNESCEEDYQHLMEAKEMLNTVTLRPSRKSVDRILAYSREEINSL